MTTVVTPPQTPPVETNGAAPPKAADAAAAPGAPAAPPAPREVSAFAKRRHALSERAKEVTAREQAAIARERAAEERIVAAEKKAADALAKAEAWERAPLQRAKEAGQNLDDIIRQGIQENTPERIAQEALAEARKIRDEIAQKEQAGRKALEEQQQRALQQEIAANRSGFVRAVASAKDAAGRAKYQYIHAEWSDVELAQHTAEFDDWARSEGKAYTFDQVAEYLDSIAKRMYESRSERRRALEQSAPGTEDREKPPPGRDPRGNGSVPHTMKGKAPSRALTQREQEEEDLATIKRAMETDRVAAEARKKK
jgi:hypothetical protein